ncbi:hypothetical protein ACQKIE_03920 [Luteibacter sp. NPDC031894]|uniref:hypothetical protein n=1 Tax=Luteibacter sp. NPDC031894 TaxID=3390572 RepID=UPI003D060207
MPFLTAHFPDQAAAMSAMNKLLGRGVPQANLVPATDATIGRSSDTASEPSNFPSKVSHRGDREPRNTSDSPSGKRLPAGRNVEPATPAELGTARLDVLLDGGLPEQELRDVFTALGATRIEQRDGDLPEEAPGVWPDAAMGHADDVRRAVQASERGATDPAPVEQPRDDAPSIREAHDPHR